jgi:hypothetical protein
VSTKNKISSYTIAYSATESEIKVRFSKDESSGFQAPWKSLVVILPFGDLRKVVSEDKEVVDLGLSAEGKKQYELK